LARELAHTMSIVFALIFAAMVHQHRRESQLTRQQAKAAIALAGEQDLAQWFAWGTALRGWALVEQSEREDGIAQLRESIASWRTVQAEEPSRRTFLLADAYARIGAADQALTSLAEALSRHGPAVGDTSKIKDPRLHPCVTEQRCPPSAMARHTESPSRRAQAA
jgi:hypothetical protein